MRTITNNAGLPVPMYNALSANTYIGGGDISATRIIAPPRIVTLRKFHEDEITEDASERIWMLLGNGVHYNLQHSKGDREDIVVETRLTMPFQGIILPDGDIWNWKVTGQPDVYQTSNHALYDYKVTSVWATMESKTEWVKQLNIQAMLHRNKGDVVESAQIVAIIRDWQHRKAKMEKDYPPVAVKVIPVPLWSQSEAIAYVTGRVKEHQKAQLNYEQSNFDVNVLPECTDDEKWYRGGGYAVKKKNTKTGEINKKADRFFTGEGALTDAKQYMSDNQATLPKGKVFAPLEERKGEYKRCLDYCDVWFKCPFGRKVREENGRTLVNEENIFGE